MFWNIVSAKKNATVMKASFEAFEAYYVCMHSWFQSSCDWSAPVWKLLRVSLAVATYAEEDPTEQKFFHALFCAGQISVALTNKGHFLQPVLNSANRGALATLIITARSVLEVHMLRHSILMVEKAVEAKDLKCTRSHLALTLFGYSVQKIWGGVAGSCRGC